MKNDHKIQKLFHSKVLYYDVFLQQDHLNPNLLPLNQEDPPDSSQSNHHSSLQIPNEDRLLTVSSLSTHPEQTQQFILIGNNYQADLNSIQILHSNQIPSIKDKLSTYRLWSHRDNHDTVWRLHSRLLESSSGRIQYLLKKEDDYLFAYRAFLQHDEDPESMLRQSEMEEYLRIRQKMRRLC